VLAGAEGGRVVVLVLVVKGGVEKCLERAQYRPSSSRLGCAVGLLLERRRGKLLDASGMFQHVQGASASATRRRCGQRNATRGCSDFWAEKRLAKKRRA
jgi:hypothetical protein